MDPGCATCYCVESQPRTDHTHLFFIRKSVCTLTFHIHPSPELHRPCPRTRARVSKRVEVCSVRLLGRAEHTLDRERDKGNHKGDKQANEAECDLLAPGLLDGEGGET